MRLCTDLRKARVGQYVLWRNVPSWLFLMDVSHAGRVQVARIHRREGKTLVFRWFHWACPGDHSFYVWFNEQGEQVEGGFTTGQTIHPFTLKTTLDFLAGWTIAQWLRWRKKFFRWLGVSFYRWA